MLISEESTLAKAVLGFDVCLYVPIKLILALVVLLVLMAADLLHLLIVVVVQPIVRALRLAQIDIEVFLQMVLLDTRLHLAQLDKLVLGLGEGEARLRSRSLRLHNFIDRRVQGLSFREGLVRLGVPQVHRPADLVDARRGLHVRSVTL